MVLLYNFQINGLIVPFCSQFLTKALQKLDYKNVRFRKVKTTLENQGLKRIKQYIYFLFLIYNELKCYKLN